MIWTRQLGRAVLCDVVAAVLRRPDSGEYEDIVGAVLALVLYPSDVLDTPDGLKAIVSAYLDIESTCLDAHIQKVLHAGSL